MEHKHIEFVTYDGKYPTLCKGVLHIVVNGMDWYFGTEEQLEKLSIPDGCGKSNPFWKSGGSIKYDVESDGMVTKGNWIVDLNLMPDYLKFYANEIADVMNEYIEPGCCGGCL